MSRITERVSRADAEELVRSLYNEQGHCPDVRQALDRLYNPPPRIVQLDVEHAKLALRLVRFVVHGEHYADPARNDALLIANLLENEIARVG